MTSSDEIHQTHDPRQTLELGQQLASRLSRGDLVALAGPLGAGKTVLARGLAMGLGLEDPRVVCSPTFVLVQEYPARLPVFHLDLYRLGDPNLELMDLGLDEMLTQGVVLVEWADRAAAVLPRPHWLVEIAITGPTGRQFRVSRVD